MDETHHEVNRGASTKNVGAGHDGRSTGKVLGRPGLVKCGRLGVQLHVPRVDTRPEDPGVVEIVLTAFDEENGEFVVQVGQTNAMLVFF